jgi:hypothetical protein
MNKHCTGTSSIIFANASLADNFSVRAAGSRCNKHLTAQTALIAEQTHKAVFRKNGCDNSDQKDKGKQAVEWEFVNLRTVNSKTDYQQNINFYYTTNDNGFGPSRIFRFRLFTKHTPTI